MANRACASYGLIGGIAVMQNIQEEFKAIRIVKNSRSWQEYERGKKYIQNTKPPKDYTKHVRELVKYLGI